MVYSKKQVNTEKALREELRNKKPQKTHGKRIASCGIESFLSNYSKRKRIRLSQLNGRVWRNG